MGNFRLYLYFKFKYLNKMNILMLVALPEVFLSDAKSKKL